MKNYGKSKPLSHWSPLFDLKISTPFLLKVFIKDFDQVLEETQLFKMKASRKNKAIGGWVKTPFKVSSFKKSHEPTSILGISTDNEYSDAGFSTGWYGFPLLSDMVDQMIPL